MEKKKLTEKESLELIAGMIQNTKKKLEIGDGNIMLFWGYLSVGVAFIVCLAGVFTRSPYSNWLWFLIPAIGFPVMKHLTRKKKSEALVSTYVDKISAGIWKIAGGMAFFGIALCTGFMLFGYYHVWLLMFIYALVIIGFAGAVQGIVIRENSLIFGGIFSVIAGGFVTCCGICNIPLCIGWAVPLFILCFVFMMIVPGHIINNKAKKQCLKN